MDLMKNWLGPTVEQHLEGALQWKKRGSPTARSSDEVLYEDDGSNLRVWVEKVGHLQILEVRSNQPQASNTP